VGRKALDILDDTGHQLYYSPINMWELLIKSQTGKLKLPVEVRALRRGLEEKGCRELPVTSRHALAIGALLFIHKDPFDRMLIAQAFVENMTLITTDTLLGHYATEVMVVSPGSTD
jgi:PIN domain nuclease of toxin-antitoxin system